jgi:membrane fusion protein (multidrug efflux system)
MKNVFRIVVLVILGSIIAFTLTRNKKFSDLEMRNAVKPVDRIPVHVIRLKEDIPVRVIRTAGTVSAVKESYIISTQAGEIINVNVKVGDHVEKGTMVAQVNDFYARKEYEIARQAWEQLRKDLERYKNVAQTEAVTGQQIEQLNLQLEGAETKMTTLERRLEETKIRSTLDGIVNQVMVKTGGMLGQGSPVCEVVNPGAITVTTGVPVYDINLIKQGAPARIFLTPGGTGLNAKIRSRGIKPDFSGKFPVVLEFESKSDPILPGAIVDIEITIRGDSAVMVPSISFVQYNGRTGIFMLENGLAVFKQMDKGNTNDDFISVKNKSFDGREVITDGVNFLSDSSEVEVQPQ